MLDIYEKENAFDIFFISMAEINPFKTENPRPIDIPLLTIDYKEKEITLFVELRKYLEENPDDDVLVDFKFFEDLYNREKEKEKEIYKIYNTNSPK